MLAIFLFDSGWKLESIFPTFLFLLVQLASTLVLQVSFYGL